MTLVLWMYLSFIIAWRNDKWYNKRFLIWCFTLVLIKINYGQIGDQTGLFYATSPVFYSVQSIRWKPMFFRTELIFTDLSVWPACLGIYGMRDNWFKKIYTFLYITVWVSELFTNCLFFIYFYLHSVLVLNVSNHHQGFCSPYFTAAFPMKNRVHFSHNWSNNSQTDSDLVTVSGNVFLYYAITYTVICKLFLYTFRPWKWLSPLVTGIYSGIQNIGTC